MNLEEARVNNAMIDTCTIIVRSPTLTIRSRLTSLPTRESRLACHLPSLSAKWIVWMLFS